jgi:hypothetical protein
VCSKVKVVVLFFLTRKGLFTVSTPPKMKQWMTATVLRFRNNWDSPFVASGRRNGNLACGLINAFLCFSKHPTPLTWPLRLMRVPPT